MFLVGRRILSAAVILSLLLLVGCTLKRASDIDEPYPMPPYEYELGPYPSGTYFPAPPPPVDDTWQMYRYYEGGRWEYPQLDRPGYRPQGDELRDRISRPSREEKSTRAPTKPTSNAERAKKVKNRAVKEEDDKNKEDEEKDRREKLREKLKRRRR
jgi:hypothetical protein